LAREDIPPPKKKKKEKKQLSSVKVFLMQNPRPNPFKNNCPKDRRLKVIGIYESWFQFTTLSLITECWKHKL